MKDTLHLILGLFVSAIGVLAVMLFVFLYLAVLGIILIGPFALVAAVIFGVADLIL